MNTTHPVISAPRIYGAKGGKGGGSARIAQESPNTLQSRATARLLDLLCAGEIRGLVNGAKSIFFDDTVLQNKNNTYNFDGVNWDLRTGTPDQAHMAGFAEVESEVPVNVQVKYGSPVTRSITDQDIDAVRVTIRFPALYKQDTTSGDMLPFEVKIAIDISTDGGAFKRVKTDDLSDKCTSPYERAYRIDLPEGGRWDIRVARLSKDSETAAEVNDTWWASYTRLIDAKLAYPDSAYIGIAVDSQLFGSSVPQRAYDIYGKIIQVPSNYNPNTRKYSGLWDGAFKRAYSDNPAWCLYDVLTDPVNGLGRELTADRIDKWSLYGIGQYCDELVPDGLGNTEPRFTFNGLINTQEDALNAIAAMAGAFRCIVYFSAGMVYFSQDRPTAYKRLLTPANVIDGMFNYEGTGHKSRHSVALVSWLDPADGFKPAVEVVEDPDSIQEFGWRTTDEVALGCISRGQAYRHGMMLLDAEKHCTTTCSFSTGLDCADIMPGDVLAIADPHHAGARAGGRLAAVSTSRATLDAPFAFAADQAYSLCVTLPDNTLLEIPLVNPGAETDTVRFSKNIKKTPLVGSVFTLVASNLAPQLFRVMGVEEGEGITFNFTCLQYDPTKYDRVEKGINLQPAPTSLLPAGALPAPHDLTHAEYLYLKSGLSPMAAITLSWAYDDPRAAGFEVEYQAPGYKGFIGKVVVSTLSLDMDIQSQGGYVFRVRAVDSLGRCGPWAQISFSAQALFKRPSNVPKFFGQAGGDFLTLTWAPAPDLHLDHYEIRFSQDMSGAATWETAQVLAGNVGKSAIAFQAPLQIGVYMIKAVTVKGLYSATAAVLSNGIGLDIARLNVVLADQEQPEWAGVKDGTVRNGGVLCLERTPGGNYRDIGYYYFDPARYDLSQVYDTRLIPTLVYSGTTLADDIYAVDDVYDLEDVYNAAGSSAYKVRMEYSATRLDPLDGARLDAHADPGGWEPWAPLVEPVTVRARAFRFRLVLESEDGFTTPVVPRAEIIMDMPDRLWSVDDFLVPAVVDGCYFAFNPPFKGVPAISAPMIQVGVEGDTYTITEKTRAGFRLALTNRNTGQPVSRRVDIIAKGYGAEIPAGGLI